MTYFVVRSNCWRNPIITVQDSENLTGRPGMSDSTRSFRIVRRVAGVLPHTQVCPKSERRQ